MYIIWGVWSFIRHSLLHHTGGSIDTGDYMVKFGFDTYEPERVESVLEWDQKQHDDDRAQNLDGYEVKFGFDKWSPERVEKTLEEIQKQHDDDRAQNSTDYEVSFGFDKWSPEKIESVLEFDNNKK
jgi:hypothetical protein